MSPVQFIDYIKTVNDVRERCLLNRILENYLYGPGKDGVDITELQLLPCYSLAVVLMLIANHKNYGVYRTMCDSERVWQYFSEMKSATDGCED